MAGSTSWSPAPGSAVSKALEGHSDALWDQTLAVSVTAVFRLIRAAVPLLKLSRHARIIILGATMSSFGGAGLAAYSSSKHAVLGLSRSLASELRPLGITVNCVQPGAIEKPMTALAFADVAGFRDFWEKKAALGRLSQPDDIADVIAFLASDDARFMSGHGIFVVGGAMQNQ